MAAQAALPSKNLSFRPQFLRALAADHLQLLLCCYSRGDATESLLPLFEPILRYSEQSDDEWLIWTKSAGIGIKTVPPWSEDLDQYVLDFWLVALAYAFDVDDSMWQRVVRAVGNRGGDALLDRVIGQRSPQRLQVSTLCYPKPYAKLMKAIEAPSTDQPALLRAFIDAWYTDLGTAAPSNRRGSRAPSWHRYHAPMKGAYFGYWCLEAVAAVKAFGLDDELCRGHPHYPGDLLREGRVTPPDVRLLEPALAVQSGGSIEQESFDKPREISWWEALKLAIRNRKIDG